MTKIILKNKLDPKIKNRQQAIIQVLFKNRDLTTKQKQEIFFNPTHPQNLTYQDLGIKKLNY